MTLNKNLQFLIDNVPNKRIIGLQGGTRSAKTYSALQFIIRLISKHSGFKISITRDTYNALKATAMEDFFELLNSVGMYHPKNYNKTDHIYYHNGNVVDFFGLDSPGKVQGRKRHILLVDEAIEADWDVVTQLKLRTTHKIIYCFNPSLIEHPIYTDLSRDDAAVCITTYKDNKHLNEATIEEIERLRLTDPDLWRVYGEGMPAQARDSVYTHAIIAPEQPVTDYCYGLDVGYQHAMSLIEVGKVGNAIQAKEVIYATNITTSDLLRMMDGKVDKRTMIHVDSARPDVIVELQRSGYLAKMANKSVTAGINVVKSRPLYITSDSVNLQREIKSYRYNPNRPDEVIKQHDDGMDAMRYGIVGLIGFGTIKSVKMSIPSETQ
jgi:phage terminase large subunit